MNAADVVLTVQIACRSCGFAMSFNPHGTEAKHTAEKYLLEAMDRHCGDKWKCTRPILYVTDMHVWIPTTEPTQ